MIRKVLEEYHLPELLGKYMQSKDLGLSLDLAAYSIVAENNAGQYYLNYTYGHPLFTDDMRIYSDAKVSDFLHSLTEEMRIGFLNEWNASRSMFQAYTLILGFHMCTF